MLATGRSVGTKIAVGKVPIIKDAANIAEFKPGEVLMVDTTN